jgi:hypothetical protein
MMFGFNTNIYISNLFFSPQTHVGVERAEHFLNQWVVHISGDPDIANQVAQDLGFHYNGIVRICCTYG